MSLPNSKEGSSCHMGTIAISGIGYRKGVLHDVSPNQLAADAMALAARDAGIRRSAIDGVIYQAGQGGGLNPDFARMADVPARLIWSLSSGGSSALAGVIAAMGLIERGLARHIAVVYSSSQRTMGLLIGSGDTSPAVQVAGVYSPGGYAALRASRYLATHGLEDSALAPVALAQRAYAVERPDALYYGRPLTPEDYEHSRYIVEPLRLFDYCQPLDAGAVVIVSALDDPEIDPARAVAIRGVGLYHTRAQTLTDVSEYEGVRAREAIEQALRMADIDLDAIDVAEVYDAFSIAVLEQLEEIGICGPGEASAFIADGRTGRLGEFPVNTGGGQLSWGYMQGHTPIIEAVVQLRGDGGPTQVPEARHALVTTPGGWVASRALAAAVLARP
jgi:acetyl-CoA acetyltransferase